MRLDFFFDKVFSNYYIRFSKKCLCENNKTLQVKHTWVLFSAVSFSKKLWHITYLLDSQDFFSKMEIIITKRIVPKNWMMSIKAEYNAWHMVGAELMLVPFFFFLCHRWSIKKYAWSGRISNYFYFYFALV